MDQLGADELPEMTFDVAGNAGGTAIVTVRGELDISNIDQLEAGVAPIIAMEPDRLVVDISELRFADSSAIAVWVRWAAVVKKIELRHSSPLLRNVITRMGLSGKLELTE
jgi:anti-anti-sigma factor